MDTVTRGEDGQALIVVVLLLAIAATAVSALGAAQLQILERARDVRAGEAAVAAAGAVVSDAYLDAAIARSGADDDVAALSQEEVAQFVSDERVRIVASAAAAELARLNGRAAPLDLALKDGGIDIEVVLTLEHRRYRAAFDRYACCSR